MDIPFLRENDRKTQTNKKKKPLPAPRRDKQPGRFMSPQPRSFLWFKPSRTQLTDRSAACFPLPGRYFRLSGLKSTNKEGRLSPHRLLPLARNRNSTPGPPAWAPSTCDLARRAGGAGPAGM